MLSLLATLSSCYRAPVVYRKNLTKGESWSYITDSKEVGENDQIFISLILFENTNISVTYLRRQDLEEAWTLNYESNTINTTFIDMGVFLPNITFTAKEDTEIRFSVFIEELLTDGCEKFYVVNTNQSVTFAYSYSGDYKYDTEGICIFAAFVDSAHIYLENVMQKTYYNQNVQLYVNEQYYQDKTGLHSEDDCESTFMRAIGNSNARLTVEVTNASARNSTFPCSSVLYKYDSSALIKATPKPTPMPVPTATSTGGSKSDEGKEISGGSKGGNHMIILYFAISGVVVGIIVVLALIFKNRSV